ncbi:MAG: hypothetical protein A3A98_04035 [Candidatus Staskawiczbacteria bacterium RIFCSPLOWO2_01_FULL_40_39]|uniref:GH10 domain-containing protein n=1 Tax=Candidatus Staskawiczbacteria bacterium RIFCSPHIGHO2_01_FULL_39_25 TaxID=1802202 RepID=A0A1G2HPE5_9BACT|nr:MAG: hypothetical protein A2730_03250 [Candidatus Staskawiczbacteria bacterium RIFCSPHIGHO2_01_FULL_39_25]OGZ73937.1 MAG: hypothetical protein A3A98_04035 [Candidatus Staskawiczbacteria bacterium RIFCSPLOWO2_01_FULL_40_39]OGZ76529.1 MAG: hypothetical protein A3I87_00210 [Candidatus Staskawiczbacteria bacterium RIFCSPLOWO2_02_FULL_39_8]
MHNIFKMFLLVFTLIFLFFLYYFFIAKAPKQEKIIWGVNFSQMQAEALGLDWKKTYLAILKDLGAKNIKLLTQWDWVEGKRDDFYFNDIDWQVEQAKIHGVKLIYVVGMKTGRWPECHVPEWAGNLSKNDQQEELLQYITAVVERYKNSDTIVAWQAENEPLFIFGKCPWYDKKFLIKEVALIKSLDATRPVIVSDSGEQSLWITAARIGDIVGTTMYRKAWFHIIDGLGFYGSFPIPPVFYWHKAQMIKYLFNKEVISVELQAEPWGSKLIYDIPLAEQEKTMDFNQFKKNIAYAKATGLKEFYLWGAEWWYWLKETQNKPGIWNEAKKMFQ